MVPRESVMNRRRSLVAELDAARRLRVVETVTFIVKDRKNLD
jgi:hypothetical protein